MAYSNYASAIYEAIKNDISTEISRCEIENRSVFPGVDDEKSFIAKHGKGIIIRIVSDEQSMIASGNYFERIYTFEARAYLRDTGRNQKNIMDFAEHIKYAIEQNPTIINNANYLMEVTIEYPESESEIKTANITIRSIYPNA